MAYTLGEAAKAAGTSKTTIHRAVKSGRLSFTKHDNGSYEIDPAELHRAFPIPSPANSSSNSQLEQNETPIETAGLRREVELLREHMADKDRVIDDLRRRLDAEGEERRKLTAILTDQRQPAPQPATSPAQKPPGFWSRLFLGQRRGIMNS